MNKNEMGLWVLSSKTTEALNNAINLGIGSKNCEFIADVSGIKIEYEFGLN